MQKFPLTAPESAEYTLDMKNQIMKNSASLQIGTLAALAGILLISSLFTGCASFSGAESNQNLAKLEYGMSESKVLSLLGTPDSVSRPNSTQDRWVYEFKSKKGRNLFIDFNNGVLAKTGELSSREVAAADESGRSGSCTHRVHPDFVQESLCIK